MLLFSSRIWSVFLFTYSRRIGKQFELTLLLQSVVMIITMFGMLQLCCTIQNTNRVSTKQHRLSGEDSQKSVRHIAIADIVYAVSEDFATSTPFFQSAPTSHQKRELFEKLWLRDGCGSLPYFDSHLFSTHLIFIYLALYSTVILCWLCIHCIYTLI